MSSHAQLGYVSVKGVDQDSAEKRESHADLQGVTGELPYISFQFVTKVKRQEENIMKVGQCWSRGRLF